MDKDPQSVREREMVQSGDSDVRNLRWTDRVHTSSSQGMQAVTHRIQIWGKYVSK